MNDHEVSYASNAKKSDLIKLFNTNVFENRQQLANEFNAAVKNSNSDEFIDMTSPRANDLTRSEQPAVEEGESNTKSVKSKKSKKSKKKTQPSPSPEMEDQMISDKLATDDKPSSSKQVSKKKKSENKVIKPSTKSHKNIPNVTITREEDLDISRDSTSFSKENIFQSSPSTANASRRSVSPEASGSKSIDHSHSQLLQAEENEKPGTPRKRKGDDDLELRKHKRAKDDEQDQVEDKAPSKRTPRKTPTKNTPTKKTPTKNTPTNDTPTNKSPINDTPSDNQSMDKSHPVDSSKHPSNKSTPRRSIKLSPSNFTSKSNISTPKLDSIAHELDVSPEAKPVFGSLEEETKNFDKHFEKSIPQSNVSTKPEISDDLAKSLGIKFSDNLPTAFPQGNEKLTPGPKLTPKPRKTDFIIEEKKSGDDVESKDNEEDSIDEDGEEDQNESIDASQHDDTDIEQESKPSPKSRSFMAIFSYITIWLILSIMGLTVYWYREQTILIGYCGQEIDEATFFSPEYPIINKMSEILDGFKPRCVNCPGHARCFEKLQLGCFEDFIEFKPWYYDLAPFINPSSKKCVPDTKKAEKLESMIEISLDLLRTKNGLVNCGKGVDNQESGIHLQQLYEILLSMKAPYITVEEFNELWERSIIELEKESEIIVRQV